MNETVRIMNKIIEEYGNPDKIRIEFARSLKKPKSVREKIKRANDDKSRRRDEYREFLKKRFSLNNVPRSLLEKFELWLELEFSEIELGKINGKIDITEFRKFSKNVKSGDREKYYLWLECGRISPYTGKVINLNQLFSPDIEIEHIIPFSISMNDSFINKTLSEREFNRDKGKKLPAQFVKNDPVKWKEYCQRVKHFKPAKREFLLTEEVPEGFLNSQLTNSAYIAKEVREKALEVCYDVQITNGQATSKLRKLWGLNSI